MYVEQTVRVAQVAAIYGLLLAGQPFVQASKTMGMSYRVACQYIPKDWHSAPAGKRPWKWHGERLAALKEAWEDHSLKTKTICELFGIHPSNLGKLAAQRGWKLRRKPKKLPVSINRMTPEMRARYIKLQPILGREAAEKAVFG